MNKLMTAVSGIVFTGLLSCGPSAASMAKKHCDLYDKYIQAEQSKDTVKMAENLNEMTKMDHELTEKYMYKNPEWLLKYVQLKEKCITEVNNKY